MKNLILSIILINILLTLQQCTTVKRYKSLKAVSVQNDLVLVDLFGTKLDDKKNDDTAKSLWQLSNRGQQELIKIFDKKFPENDKFIEAINNKYLEEEVNPVIDFTSNSLKMIFSISKKYNYENLLSESSKFSLADRIEYLNFNIELQKDVNVVFSKWNKFSTEYATVDIADVSFANSLEISGSLGQSGSKTTESKTGTDDNNNNTSTNVGSFTPSISGKGTFSRTENQKIKYRYIQLKGNLSDKKIEMEQEGMREIDLSGNVIVDVYLKFDATTKLLFSIKNILDKEGNLNTPDKLNAKVIRVKIPDLPNLPTALTGKLNCKYVYRHVVSGARTFYEWDDKIVYYHGSFEKNITLLKSSDFIPTFYTIGLQGEDAKKPEDRTEIKIIDDENLEYPLLFSNINEGKDFLKWLKNFPDFIDKKGNIEKNNKSIQIKINKYNFTLTKNGKSSPLTKEVMKSITDDVRVLQYFR